jgi:hypothetical protein
VVDHPDEPLAERLAELPLELETGEHALERGPGDSLRPREDRQPHELVRAAVREHGGQVCVRGRVRAGTAEHRPVGPVNPPGPDPPIRSADRRAEKLCLAGRTAEKLGL